MAAWQKASLAFDLSDGDSSTTKTPDYVSIGLRYYRQANTVYFDNAQLVKDISGSYTYDSDGNIVKTVESAEQSSAFTYDDASNLTSIKDAENNLYEYSYNDAHQVTEAVSPIGQKIGFAYNSLGGVTTSKVSSSDDSMAIQTDTAYNGEQDGIAAGAYVVEETDAAGNVTRYSYDVQSGKLLSTTSADGTVSTYTYDEKRDLLTKVTSGGTSVEYTYEAKSDRLTAISHNGLTYSFTYDVYGNIVKTSVGSTALNTNTYTSGNGKLEKSTYGNGDVVEYGQDRAGNITSMKVNGTTKYEWLYDASLLLAQYKDHVSSRKTVYEYDVTGRIIGIRVSNLANTSTDVDSVEYEMRYGYDDLNNVTTQSLTAGARTYNTTYTYNKNSQPATMTAGSRTVTYSYDALGRLGGRAVSTTSALKYNYVYHASDIRNGSSGTKYQTTYVEKELIGNTAYLYEYDEMGNIISIAEGTRKSGTENTVENSTIKVTYEYDSKSQLTRENNLYLNQTVVYSYDGGGNLTSKKVYAYTTAADLGSLTPTKTVSYGYDSTWKDRMVSYDGTAVTYDAIGNPLSYRGKTMTWEGRNLESLTSGSTSIRYLYDSDGLRIEKTVGSTKSEYYYSNGQLSYEKRGTQEFWYCYDGYGNLSMFYYRNGSGTPVMYVVATNSRGDVEALYNESGALVAKYTYDSWGKILSVTDASGNAITSTSHIGNLNPIRYRGYYYDVETGFYYVSSRYYDPEIGRFISADTTDILGVQSNLYDKNLYAYCDNNPVMRKDADGDLWILAAGAVAGFAGQYVANVLSNYFIDNKSLADSLAITTGDIPGLLGGTISGMLSVTGMSAVGLAVSNAAINATTYLAECGLSNQKVNAAELIVSVGVGAVMDGTSKPFNGDKVRGVIETANRYISNSSSAKKKAMYAAKKTVARSSVVKNGFGTVVSTSIGTAISRAVLSVGKWFASKFKL